MALTSTSTLADAYAQYRASLYFESDATGGKARDLVEAARYMLAEPNQQSAANFGISYDRAFVQAVCERAERWLAAKGLAEGTTASTTNPRAVGADFRNFRE